MLIYVMDKATCSHFLLAHVVLVFFATCNKAVYEGRMRLRRFITKLFTI